MPELQLKYFKIVYKCILLKLSVSYRIDNKLFTRVKEITCILTTATNEATFDARNSFKMHFSKCLNLIFGSNLHRIKLTFSYFFFV